MRITKRATIAGLALALAAAGGSVAAVRAVTPGSAAAAPAALRLVPAAPRLSAGPAGPAPRDGRHSPSGSAAAVSPRHTAGAGTAPQARGQRPRPAAPPPPDGAVPGASAALRALAAARAGTTLLPHSPRLLRALRAPARPAGVTAGTTPGGASPPATVVAGLDVASYQHKKTARYPDGAPVAWSQVAAAGYRFAAVKATEGDYYVNPWAAADLAAAKAAGLYVTAYHFAIPNAGGGAAQARFALAGSGYASGPRMLPLMLDIEYDPYVAADRTNECYGLTPAAMTSWIAAFTGAARQLTGQYPVIYTTADWWNACTGGSTAFRADPMWVAAYGVASPPLPAAWPAWTYWQYTSGGTVPGVPTAGATDLSRFNVSLPGLVSPGGQASRPGTRVSLRIPALAALAGTALTYSVSGLPAGLWISPGGLITGQVGGTATRQPAAYQVTISATAAGGGTGTVSFRWRVASACGSYLAAAPCPGRG